ncbi:hypothetical protein MROS_1170 [Melioribacter roseus P3M-2]|uniref:Uncharacterized protein n=1 Tax=Melioribacter roseus (strain DSM 23840 / JCM 17771 / VKM B-2668 / P3M-2) TaxID=1191523 RepID=I6ZZL8_MELRP|nr:hypothetical protein MROS_1170 [Melioribacter roseus P3M-2]
MKANHNDALRFASAGVLGFNMSKKKFESKSQPAFPSFPLSLSWF